MNIFFPGWRFRRTAPILPPEPDHTLKHTIEGLYHEASMQRRIAMAADTEYRDAQEASEKSRRLIAQIKQTAGASSDAHRAARRSFADRACTTNSGQNILFLDPDCSLQDPHVPPPAGVNHAGRRAKFTWDDKCVANLLRILEHTNARIVLTSKWRNRATMRTNLNRELLARGLPPLIGRTQVMEDTGGGRAMEVLAFIDQYSDGGSTQGATVHGWCALDERNFENEDPDYDYTRFFGHFVRTDKTAGLSETVADRAIELIRGKALDSPKRAFRPAPFARAPGLQYRIDPDKSRAEKSSVYDAMSSDSDSDSDSGGEISATATSSRSP